VGLNNVAQPTHHAPASGWSGMARHGCLRPQSLHILRFFLGGIARSMGVDGR
jgi:hypothetical protein